MSIESPVSKAEKLDRFYSLVQDPEIQPEIQTWFDGMLATSKLNLVKRVATIETVTGLDDFSDLEDEEREPTLPEKINLLAEKIEQIESNSQAYTTIENQEIFIPETKTEKTVIELAKFAASLPVKDGVKAITPTLFHHFRKHILPEELRPNTINPRQWKKDVSDKMRELCTSIKPDKKGNNRGIRLLFPRNFNVGMLNCKSNVS